MGRYRQARTVAWAAAILVALTATAAAGPPSEPDSPSAEISIIGGTP